MLKKSTTPVADADVAAIVMNEQEGKVEVVSNAAQIQVTVLKGEDVELEYQRKFFVP